MGEALYDKQYGGVQHSHHKAPKATLIQAAIKVVRVAQCESVPAGDQCTIEGLA